MINLFRRIAEFRERQRRQTEEEIRRATEVWQKWETDIKPLPIEEAQRRAEVLLADPTHFRCESDPTTERERLTMELLAPRLKEFFQQYSHVRHVDDSGEYLARSLLWSQPVITDDRKVSDQFLTVGWMGEEDTLIVKHGEETITKWGAGEETTYPGIYHLLLLLDLFSTDL